MEEKIIFNEEGVFLIDKFTDLAALQAVILQAKHFKFLGWEKSYPAMLAYMLLRGKTDLILPTSDQYEEIQRHLTKIQTEVAIRRQKGMTYHQEGYNCAQATAAALAKDVNHSIDDLYRISEGFGKGMGIQEVCGAVSGINMIISLSNSSGSEQPGLTKEQTYNDVAEYVSYFKERQKSYLCKEMFISREQCDYVVADGCEIGYLYLLIHDLL